MIRSFFHRLKFWLTDLWLDVVLAWHSARADRMREDQEPFYRPVQDGRLFRGPFRFVVEDEDGEEIGGVDCIQAHCCNCGHRGPAVLPDGRAAEDGELVDMLECPECGLYTMCSD
jgi:hypothetical protein